MSTKIFSNPKQLFLIDGLGALVSAFSLGVLLVKWEDFFGMPAQVLYPLSFVACLFATYSLFCHFQTPKNWRPFLKAIAIANLIYCCVTIGLVINHYPSLTVLGLLYFLGELIIVISLSIMELKIAGKN